MFYSKLAIVVFTLLFSTSLTGAVSEDEIVKQMTNPSRYNAKVRPEGYRIIDTVNMYIRTIDYIDDIKEEYQMQVTFRQQWRDIRFNITDARSFSPKGYVTITDSSLIWTPDVFFTNKRSGFRHQLLSSNEMIRIYPSGDVLYSARLTLGLACQMDFSRFPHDVQECKLKAASYAHTEDELFIQWKTESAIQINPHIKLPLHEVEKFETTQTSSETITGSYSAIGMTIYFRRKAFGYFWIHVYIPTSMLVLCAYYSLWARDLRIRYLISLASLLVAATQIAEINRRLPQTTYTKGIDIWTGICLTFIMVSLVIHVVVDNMSKPGSSGRECNPSATICLLEQDSNRNKGGAGGDMATGEDGAGTQTQVTNSRTPKGSSTLKKACESAGGLIAFARIAYPVAYFIFMALYTVTRFF